MTCTITTDKESNTISGTFRITLGGDEGQLMAEVQLRDMTPSDFSQIHSRMQTVASEIIRALVIHTNKIS